MPAPAIAFEALSAWEVGRIAAVDELKPERVWRVTAGDGVFVLKNWGVKDDGLEQRVRFYQDVMAHVAAQGIAVERALPTRENTVIRRKGAEAWWLVRALPNDPRALVGDEGEALQRNYGGAIAGLHRALATFPPEDARRRTWRKAFRQEVLQQIAGIRARLSGDERTEFERVAGAHEHDLAGRLEGLPEQLIFFDCHHGNILRVGATITGFIDSDHLSIGLRIWDLFYLLSQGLAAIDAEGAAGWSRHANLVIAGYQAANPLTDRERAAIWSGLLGLGIGALWAALEQAPNLTAARLGVLAALNRVRPYFP
jgi:Ser/Thr protein kinase RdoA (MazF antagonist)